MFYNLTNEELFRLTGSLPPERIEGLLDNAAAAAGLEGIGACVAEAKTCFFAEDALSPILSQLTELAKNLRGNNKQELLGIIESLDDFAQCQFHQGDYGRDELHKVEKALAEAGF